MSIEPALIVTCLLLLMLAGVAVIGFALIRFSKAAEPAEIAFGQVKLTIKGPAWLLAIVLGGLMIASPVIAITMNRSPNVTEPLARKSDSNVAESIKEVEKIYRKDPTSPAFHFTRDMTFLDLRAAVTPVWQDFFEKLRSGKPRIRPGVLKNYMTVRKMRDEKELHIVYSTRGLLDVRCLTHAARYEHATDSGQDAWDVIADVSNIPVGTEFEIAVEATMWNGFSGAQGDDFATSANDQTTGAEEVSTILVFPEGRPFKGAMDVEECVPAERDTDDEKCSPFRGVSRQTAGNGNGTFYWSTTAPGAGRGSYYHFVWKW